jgi:hypothetical protein
VEQIFFPIIGIYGGYMKNFLLIIVILIGSTQTGFGCSCLPSANAKQELEQSVVVFSGKVLEVKRNDQPEGAFTSVEAVFEVESVWKGIEKSRVSVFTSAQSSACGYGFRKGETYLVYASQSTNGQYITSICSRTRPLKAAEGDLKELGEGKVITKEGKNRV